MLDRTLTALAAGAALALDGCMADSARSDVADEANGAAAPADVPAVAEAKREFAPTTPAPVLERTDGLTGIIVCDDYLSHYQACHRTIEVFDEPTIVERYTTLRDVLTRDAGNQARRADVETRCIALEAQMRDQLAGRECEAELDSTPLVDQTGEFD